MKKTAILGGLTGLVLAGGVSTVALAAPNLPARDTSLHVSVSPLKPSQGQTVNATLTNGRKSVGYVCILTTYKKGVKLSAGDSNVNSAVLNIHPNNKGVAKCQQVFLSFKSPNGHSCPPTHKDKRHGWKCGVAFADPKHRSHWNVGLFKF
jgi:hypothetical protein